MDRSVARPNTAWVGFVFTFVFLVYAYFMPQWADWNIDSRLDLVHAIVDGHTFRIDRYHANTWDKAVYGGHYYSDKAPGTAFLGAVVYGVYALARAAPVSGGVIQWARQSDAWLTPIKLGKSDTQSAPAARGRTLGGCQRTGTAGNVQYIPWGNRLVPPVRDWALSKYVVTIGVDALLSALFAAFFFWFLGFLVVGLAIRILLTALYAFATSALPYSSNFYSHQLAAGMLFSAFALLYLYSRNRIGKWSMPVTGFLLGFALLTEYTVALVVGLIGLYALFVLRTRVRSLGQLIATALIPIGTLLVYNFACFGNALDTGYSHDFCWSAAQAAGIAGFTTPQSGPLFDLTLGTYRGLFFLSPFLLLAVPGAIVMVKRGLRAEALLCLAIGILFIVTISAYWGWNGGRVNGPRYLVPIIPFLAFPVVFLMPTATRSLTVRAIIILSGAWSLVVVWIQFLAGDTFPTSWLRNPVLDYSWPALQDNRFASNAGLFLGLRGWQSLLPLGVLLLVLLAITGTRQALRVRAPTAGVVGGSVPSPTRTP